MTRDRLRILVVAPWPPWPLSHGGKLRLHHLLRGLADHDDVTLAIPSACDDAGDVGQLAAIEVMTAGVNQGDSALSARNENAGRKVEAPPAKPRLVSRLVRRHFGYDDAIDAWLRRHATPARFDVALCVGPKFGQYVDAVGVPCVWDAVDDLVLYAMREAQYAGAARWPAAARAGSLYAAYERHVARSAAATVFTSSVDAECARRWVGDGPRIEVVTNGVDFDYFNPDAVGRNCMRLFTEAYGGLALGNGVGKGGAGFQPAGAGSKPAPPHIVPQAADSPCHAQPGAAAVQGVPQEGLLRIVFVGALDFQPNVDGIVHFARRIWPDLYRQGRQLEIVGRRPTEAVQSLAAIPGVCVAGEVPDVRPWLLLADVVIVPTRAGGGVKNKVLEACAMGRPVVASPRALGGLSARAGTDLLCAGAPAEWINCIEDLLGGRAKAEAIGKAGQRWVRAAHRWSDAAERMRCILAEAAGSATSERSKDQEIKRSRDREIKGSGASTSRSLDLSISRSLPGGVSCR